MSTDLKALLDQFVPTELRCDTSRLDAGTRAALPHLVAAMRGIDALYHAQLGPQVTALFDDPPPDDLARQALAHFNGPYNELDENKPFLDGVAPAVPGRALYPKDLTEEALAEWLGAHPDQKESLLSPTTVITRSANGGLSTVPYHQHFRALLEPVAASLRAAADSVTHAGLARFLRNRAAALLGEGSLRDSDAEWVRLTDAPLEVVIGPFEVYEDNLQGVKAFYEGMLFAIDAEAGAHLKEIEASMDALAAAFPMPAGAQPARGGMAPMVVADEIIATGDGHAGVLAAAFNLPNDPWVRATVGWKQVMIRNVMRAKFDACTQRIAERLFAEDQVGELDFDAFFYFVLLHEVSHGLGPAFRADGTSVNEACGKHHTALEEAKADIGSMVLLLTNAGTCGIPALAPASVGTSYLAGLYRSVRFGLHEAHGKANVVEFTFLERQGALERRDGRVRVVAERLLPAAQELLEAICTLQASDSAAELAAFLADYGSVPAQLEADVARLTDLPIDILPRYPV